MIIPDTKVVEKTVTMVFELLFPVGDDLRTEEMKPPRKKLRAGLESILECLTTPNKYKPAADKFISMLPMTKKKLLKDADFILASDPAAKSLIEVVAIYPGFFAIFCFRIAHCFSKMHIPLLPRMITEYAHRLTGIDIHPGASIGCPFAIDHGTGIVIGETTKIGHKVIVYQGVTLGALSVSKNKASNKRHPTIEDNVVIYANSTILGGDTVVGRNSVIGGNVFLTESVGPYSVVYHKSEIIVRDHKDYRAPVDFAI